MALSYLCPHCGHASDPSIGACRVLKCDVCRSPISAYVSWNADDPVDVKAAQEVIKKHQQRIKDYAA